MYTLEGKPVFILPVRKILEGWTKSFQSKNEINFIGGESSLKIKNVLYANGSEIFLLKIFVYGELLNKMLTQKNQLI